MFPCRISLPDAGVHCRLVSSSRFQCNLQDVAVFGECCPFGRNSSLNRLVLVLVFGSVSLSFVSKGISLKFVF